jgi:hypothetical protein
MKRQKPPRATSAGRRPETPRFPESVVTDRETKGALIADSLGIISPSMGGFEV